jgi:hypothetical protein
MIIKIDELEIIEACNRYLTWNGYEIKDGKIVVENKSVDNKEQIKISFVANIINEDSK